MQKLTRHEQLRMKNLSKPNTARGREERTPADEIEALLLQTTDADPGVRCESVRHLCPCHVQANYDKVWDRLIELVDDPDPKVRKTVLHTLADGSPRERETEVVSAIEKLYNDPDLKLRKAVRTLLAKYRRGGRINIL